MIHPAHAWSEDPTHLLPERVHFGPFVLDGSLCQLRCGDRPVRLRRKPMSVLWYLIHHRERVVPKSELIEQLWPDSVVSECALTSAICAIRVALRRSGQEFIETSRGHGYRFSGEIWPARDTRRDPAGESVARSLACDTTEQKLLESVRCGPTTPEPTDTDVYVIVVRLPSDEGEAQERIRQWLRAFGRTSL